MLYPIQSFKRRSAIDDFMRPDRVVVGADNKESLETMRELYAPYI